MHKSQGQSDWDTESARQSVRQTISQAGRQLDSQSIGHAVRSQTVIQPTACLSGDSPMTTTLLSHLVSNLQKLVP